MNNNKIVNVFLFRAAPYENFGEYLCKKILDEMNVKCKHYSQANPPPNNIGHIMTGIGGFLNNNIYSSFFGDRINKWYVWGSGVECQPILGQTELPDKVLKEKCVISMLRGPMTKDYYNIKDDILLADPGYLASYFFKFPKEEKKSIFIQFYYDKIPTIIPDVDVHLTTLLKPKQGTFDLDFFEILKNISNASIVLTGSMHVAITAHSYGVPWAIVAKEHVDASKEWKWQDTTACMGLDKEDLKICTGPEDGLIWYNSVKDKFKPVTLDYQNEIIRVFPFND